MNIPLPPVNDRPAFVIVYSAVVAVAMFAAAAFFGTAGRHDLAVAAFGISVTAAVVCIATWTAGFVEAAMDLARSAMRRRRQRRVNEDEARRGRIAELTRK